MHQKVGRYPKNARRMRCKPDPQCKPDCNKTTQPYKRRHVDRLVRSTRCRSKAPGERRYQPFAHRAAAGSIRYKAMICPSPFNACPPEYFHRLFQYSAINFLVAFLFSIIKPNSCKPSLCIEGYMLSEPT